MASTADVGTIVDQERHHFLSANLRGERESRCADKGPLGHRGVNVRPGVEQRLDDVLVVTNNRSLKRSAFERERERGRERERERSENASASGSRESML